MAWCVSTLGYLSSLSLSLSHSLKCMFVGFGQRCLLVCRVSTWQAVPMYAPSIPRSWVSFCVLVRMCVGVCACACMLVVHVLEPGQALLVHAMLGLHAGCVVGAVLTDKACVCWTYGYSCNCLLRARCHAMRCVWMMVMNRGCLQTL